MAARSLRRLREEDEEREEEWSRATGVGPYAGLVAQTASRVRAVERALRPTPHWITLCARAANNFTFNLDNLTQVPPTTLVWRQPCFAKKMRGFLLERVLFPITTPTASRLPWVESGFSWPAGGEMTPVISFWIQWATENGTISRWWYTWDPSLTDATTPTGADLYDALFTPTLLTNGNLFMLQYNLVNLWFQFANDVFTGNNATYVAAQSGYTIAGVDQAFVGLTAALDNNGDGVTLSFSPSPAGTGGVNFGLVLQNPLDADTPPPVFAFECGFSVTLKNPTRVAAFTPGNILSSILATFLTGISPKLWVSAPFYILPHHVIDGFTLPYLTAPSLILSQQPVKYTGGMATGFSSTDPDIVTTVTFNGVQSDVSPLVGCAPMVLAHVPIDVTLINPDVIAPFNILDWTTKNSFYVHCNLLQRCKSFSSQLLSRNPATGHNQPMDVPGVENAHAATVTWDGVSSVAEVFRPHSDESDMFVASEHQDAITEITVSVSDANARLLNFDWNATFVFKLFVDD